MIPETLIHVADLIGSPGSSRRVDVVLPVPADFEMALVDPAETVHLSGSLDSVVDGILVRGDLRVEVSWSCARCLTTGHEVLRAPVAELYHDSAEVAVDDDADEGYRVDTEQIDLEILVRDALAEVLPPNPVCRPDCKGLCPQCGVDRNTETCSCHDADVDRRWDALADLKLDH